MKKHIIALLSILTLVLCGAASAQLRGNLTPETAKAGYSKDEIILKMFATNPEEFDGLIPAERMTYIRALTKALHAKEFNYVISRNADGLQVHTLYYLHSVTPTSPLIWGRYAW